MFKRYLKLTIYTSIVSFLATYIFVEALIYKSNKEIEITRSIISSIHQLKDLHTMCILDYKFNPHNEEILTECKKVEQQIHTTLNNYNENTPFLNFYTKYFN